MRPVDRPDDALSGVVEALPVGIFALDPDGRVVVWNSTAERLTGWPAAEVVGHDMSGSVTLDVPTAARILDELRAGRAFSGKLPATPRTGRSVYFRAAPGPAGAVVGVLQDVGETDAEDEAFALLDALWESAPVGLAYFDIDARYRRVNGAVIDIDGGTVDDRIGRTLAEVHGPTGAAIAAGLVATLVDGVTRTDVAVQGRLWHGRGPDQEWRINYYAVRSPEGSIVGGGVVIVDVTVAEGNRRELAAVAAEREHALNRYQSLVEATSAAVWIRAADCSASADAPGLRAITGQSAAAQAGWGFLDAVHPVHRESLGRDWRAAAAADPAEVFTRAYRLRTAGRGYRWFRMRAVPVHAAGRVVEWVGTETDIDDAMRSRERLDVLAKATFAMKAALDPEGELAALAEAVVPDFADLCRVYLFDPSPLDAGAVTGRRSVTRARLGMPESPSSGERFVFRASHPIAVSRHTGTPLLTAVTTDPMPEWGTVGDQAQWGLAIAVNSMLVAPVHARGEVVAALLFISCGDRPPYTEDDLGLVGELADRASAAVDTAVTFQRSRQVSVALQSAMLAEPAVHPGVAIEARYLPAAAELQVGGDWYDAFSLPGGDLAVGVGDVVGHDLPAAATMGQLRSMLRGLAHDSEAAPSEVVARLDRVACGLNVTPFTTLIYGRLSRREGCTVFRWSNAGHPAPLLVEPGAAPRVLAGVDVVLGVDPTTGRTDREVELPPGSTLVLYTDGLVERRSDPDDEALGELLTLVRDSVELPLPAFCDQLVRGSTADTGDDIAVLALRVDR
jgi:PAS domain S-box-containing protein